MLLWTPEGSEGQSLHLWLAASCHSARSGRAGEKALEKAAKNDSNNILIQNETNDKKNNNNKKRQPRSRSERNATTLLL